MGGILRASWKTPGFVRFICPGRPDSRKVSLLSEVVGEASLELGVATAGTEGDYRSLDRGSPYYWDWRGDSSSLLAHVNMGKTGADGERLSILTLDKEPFRSDIPTASGVFQAPSFLPDGKSLLYVSTSDTTSTLHLRPLDGSAERTLGSGEGGAYFSLSPDGKRVAYLAALSIQPVPVGIMGVADLSGKEPLTNLPDVPVLSFFWSPDSRTLAFLTPDTANTSDPLYQAAGTAPYVRLMGYDPSNGKSWLIARFPPSRGIISLLPYFDQYMHSCTLWSPDSRFLAFTAETPDGSPGVFVARADGNIKPRMIAAGDFAFWSPR